MKYLQVAALLSAAVCAVFGQEQQANVNERYTVESVEITGADQARLDRATRDDLKSMIGQKYSQDKLDQLCKMLNKAFNGRAVSITLSRGSAPEHVRITFVVKGSLRRFDISAPQAVYHAKQGWSGEVDGTMRVGDHSVLLGVLSDTDTLVERSTGLRVRYDNHKLISNRLRAGFEFGSYHTTWNGSTKAEAAAGDLYRSRQSIEPVVTAVLGRSLLLTCGMSFQYLEKQFPAARTEAANAVITTLRYDRQLEDSGSGKHRLEAGYGLRAATRTLDSDYVYVRHTADFAYTLWHGNHKMLEQFRTGLITGGAPMFERFALGNSTTLRGWNKYDVSPLGGSRMAYNSVEYRYRSVSVFYDAGAVWDRGQNASAKHAAGAGLHIGDLVFLVAFPLRQGRAEPVFIAGLNL